MTLPSSVQPVDADRNGELEQNRKVTIRSVAAVLSAAPISHGRHTVGEERP
jgi:hypothetical protein